MNDEDTPKTIEHQIANRTRHLQRTMALEKDNRSRQRSRVRLMAEEEAMNRVTPREVVTAYTKTNNIPIRQAWTSQDPRGGCAFETMAQARGVDCNSMIADMDQSYVKGFIDAWDADKPQEMSLLDLPEQSRLGFQDGYTCRRAVEAFFTSEVEPKPAPPKQAG